MAGGCCQTAGPPVDGHWKVPQRQQRGPGLADFAGRLLRLDLACSSPGTFMYAVRSHALSQVLPSCSRSHPVDVERESSMELSSKRSRFVHGVVGESSRSSPCVVIETARGVIRELSPYYRPNCCSSQSELLHESSCCCLTHRAASLDCRLNHRLGIARCSAPVHYTCMRMRRAR